MQKIDADNPITPEDVGRVAVGENGRESKVVHVGPESAALDQDGYLYICDLDGVSDDGMSMDITHWKPRTLQAPFKWWNVWREDNGKYTACSYATLAEADCISLENKPTARVYGAHWHGAEEGTFHTEEDAERIRAEADND